jgi:signal transduction histidine kinase
MPADTKTKPPDLAADAHAKKIRWILLGAFGGMLVLMIVAGLSALDSLQKLNQISNELSEHFTSHSRALLTVIVSVHTYNDNMEQYLMSDTASTDSPTASQVQYHAAEAHSALDHYPQDCGREERLLLTRIAQLIAAQDSSFTEALTWPASDRVRRGHIFVHQQLIPRRTQLLELAQQVSALNNQALAEENQTLALDFSSLQTRLARMVLLTLVAGLLLSLAAGFYIWRLEQEGRERYVALVRSRQELEGLSRRLVDAQEAERRSISRELHDEVGQTLGALLVYVSQLTNLVPAGDKILEGQIERIKSAAETAVKSIRDMALLLRPPMLDDLGLIPALEWQARETSRRSDMEVDVEAGELKENLPDEIKVGIYRLVQEALQNAATHARAKHAQVAVKQAADKVIVEIIDDGEGFDAQRTRGMGILGMEERVRQLRGIFKIDSAPGKGTTVHAELPLAGQDLA